MALANILQSQSESKTTRGEIYFFLTLGALFSLLFYLANSWLLSQHFAQDGTLFFGEKASLAHYGDYPALDNWIFITPLIPYTLALFLNNAWLSGALIGGFSLSLWLYLVFRLFKRRQLSLPLWITITLYLLLTPSCLWLFSQKTAFLFTLNAFMLALYTLRKYYFENISVLYLVFGIAAGLLIQNTIVLPTLFLVLLIPALFVIMVLNKPLLPFLLALFFPPIFLLVAPMSMNYFLNSDFSLVHFTGNLRSLDAYRQETQGHFFWSLWITLKTLVLYTPFILPYWLFWGRIPRYAYIYTYVSLLIAPLLYFFMAHYYGALELLPGALLIFIFFSLVLFSKPFGIRFEESRKLTLLMMGAFILSFGFDWAAYLSGRQELAFLHLLKGDTGYENLLEESQLAEKLKNTEGLILVDDTLGFKVVYLTDHPERFVLPYQYNFPSVLSSPRHFVDYIITTDKPEHDLVLATYPEAPPGFTLLDNMGKYRLYKNIENKGGVH